MIRPQRKATIVHLIAQPHVESELAEGAPLVMNVTGVQRIRGSNNAVAEALLVALRQPQVEGLQRVNRRRGQRSIDQTPRQRTKREATAHEGRGVGVLVADQRIGTRLESMFAACPRQVVIKLRTTSDAVAGQESVAVEVPEAGDFECRAKFLIRVGQKVVVVKLRVRLVDQPGTEDVKPVDCADCIENIRNEPTGNAGQGANVGVRFEASGGIKARRELVVLVHLVVQAQEPLVLIRLERKDPAVLLEQLLHRHRGAEDRSQLSRSRCRELGEDGSLGCCRSENRQVGKNRHCR